MSNPGHVAERLTRPSLVTHPNRIEAPGPLHPGMLAPLNGRDHGVHSVAELNGMLEHLVSVRDISLPPADVASIAAHVRVASNAYRDPPDATVPRVPDVIAASCPIYPPNDKLTNNQYLFLAEIGGPPCLKSFLNAVIAAGPSGAHWQGTLIIDSEVLLAEPIVIPTRFTLAGVGIHGAGRLIFSGDFGDVPAISFQENEDGGLLGMSVIRDIAIRGPGGANSMQGVKVGSNLYVPPLDTPPPDPPPNCTNDGLTSNAMGNFQLHRVSVTGFGRYGLQGGMNTYSVIVKDCEITECGVGIQLAEQCNSWRIIDCYIADANIGVDIAQVLDVQSGKCWASNEVTDSLVFGCRLENCGVGVQIQVDPLASLGDTVFGVNVVASRFEENGKAIVVQDGQPASTRILLNYFGLNQVLETPPNQLLGGPLTTQIGFNLERFGLGALNLLYVPFWGP